ncbi:dTDP-4-dehydrorhamnose 3,5-epimerase [Ramlibacter sp. MMS24-I3-19]|uniref:dTDP-4-dehydrorhamnose 3,5-epimerase n=1 Tax=Ramlibacter sp. MMS24-I3-19 TaxID=3416606 RepID=UPI003D06C23E
MIFVPTELPGAMLVDVEPRADARGWFARTYCEREFAAHGLPTRMVQSNVSVTHRAGTLRGMHWQAAPHQEDKLVRCVRGAVWDAIVDIRPGSATFCRWLGVALGEATGRALLVPKGFAHGFISLTDEAVVVYQVSEFHAPQAERGARHDDPAFGIAWPRPVAVIADKDRAWPEFIAATAASDPLKEHP